MKAYLLAAGKGSRLRPLTDLLPKPLVPFLNRPLVHTQHQSLLAHCQQVRFNVSHLAAPLIRYIKSNPHTSYSLEPTPLGSARTVWAERSYFDQTTVVACADVLASYEVARLVEQHRASGAWITIATTTVSDPSRFGVLVCDAVGRVRQFQEKPEHPRSHTISTGVYVFAPRVLQAWQPEWMDLGSEAFPALVAKGVPVYACPIGSAWADVGTLETYLHTQLAHLGSGNLVHPTAQIHPTAQVHRCVVGPRAVVGAWAQLSDCVLWSRVRVEAHVAHVGAVLTPDGVVQVPAGGSLVSKT
ncbi:nucleotidyltransferase family protein [Anthocerotibacter panamensis]|uniref:nucleotidyltransferase family protein n=1 Tax=Anthocerotibacter panamensis TaxID=2857077 RepID=UPI001C40331D|nr:sugar phosphate nucleotidyltransferase [Anthocerotibacter panamensis]